MTCLHLHEQIWDYLYGLLDEQEAQPLRDHLADCPACQEELRIAQVQQKLLARAAFAIHDVPPFALPDGDAPAAAPDEPAILPLSAAAPARRSPAKRWWPAQDAVGRTVRVDTAPGQPVTMTVVGVIADNRAAQPGLLVSEPGPELYRPYVQAPSPFPLFVIAAQGDPASLLKPVRDLMVRAVPDRPLSATLAASTIADQLAGVRSNARQALWVAIAGLVLALLGVHGVLAYTVRRRTREIGIRGAMGATRGHIVVLILRQSAMLVAIGLVVGIPAARAASRVLDGLLYHTDGRDPSIYALVAGCLVLTAALAGVVPLLRALRVQPLEALRAERT